MCLLAGFGAVLLFAHKLQFIGLSIARRAGRRLWVFLSDKLILTAKNDFLLQGNLQHKEQSSFHTAFTTFSQPWVYKRHLVQIKVNVNASFRSIHTIPKHFLNYILQITIWLFLFYSLFRLMLSIVKGELIYSRN